MKKPAVLGAIGVAVLTVLLCIAFQWRYDQVRFTSSSPLERDQIRMVRTNRFSGAVQVLDQERGWVAPSETRASGPAPQAASASAKKIDCSKTSFSKKTCDILNGE